MCGIETSVIPIWRKYALTIEEAASYFRIGENKLRDLINQDRRASYVLMNGNRTLIKRRLFEEYLDHLDTV